jgi:phosphonate transport system ATP-binding protein
MHDVDLALEYSTRIIGIKDGGIALDAAAGGLTRADLDFLYRD